MLCLVLAGLLLAGLALCLFRFFSDGGGTGPPPPFNRHLYNSAGQLISGTLLDRDGEVLSAVDQSGSRTYPDGETRRKSILHVVGDPYGSIGTGALTAFADRLTGFDLLNGAFGAQRGNQVYLTIDADLNETAYRALNGRKGTVAVYNYQTGEILCLVSSPSFDPRNIPSGLETDPSYDGVYLNRFLSSTFPPGSIFKTVTWRQRWRSCPTWRSAHGSVRARPRSGTGRSPAPLPTGSRTSERPWPTPAMWCSASWRWSWAAPPWSAMPGRRA